MSERWLAAQNVTKSNYVYSHNKELFRFQYHISDLISDSVLNVLELPCLPNSMSLLVICDLCCTGRKPFCFFIFVSCISDLWISEQRFTSLVS